MGTRPRHQHHRVTLWHESFHDVVVERAPPGIDVIGEFVLSRRPRRADLLLLRRKHVARRDREARILRALWPRLADATLVELKSPSRGFRPSDLIRLVSYGMQYHAEHLTEVGPPTGLTLVLVAPVLTRPLEDEIALMGWRLEPLGDGYAAIVGPWYTTYAVFTNDVSDAEDDDFLRIFSQRELQTLDAYHWFDDWFTERQSMPHVKRREGYGPIRHKILSYLTPEERLEGLTPEDRLAGLAPEEQILALSDEVLRGLPDEYIRTLPERVQQTIRKRLGTPR